jgi:hypothetical protein
VEESQAGKEVNVSGTQYENVASCIVAGRDGLPFWVVGEDHTPTPDDSVCNGNSVEFMGTADANGRGGYSFLNLLFGLNVNEGVDI